MAKWDERDQRWIVSNRSDGKNVNNWHWTETDLSTVSKRLFEDSLVGQKVTNNKIDCKLTSLTHNGEVSVNTRKQKVIMFYELDVTIQWEGEWTADSGFYKGTVKLPYISEENDDDDFEVQVTIDSSEKSAQELKPVFYKEVSVLLKKKVPEILQSLRNIAEEKTNMSLKASPSAKLLDKTDLSPISNLRPEQISEALRQHDKENENKGSPVATPTVVVAKPASGVSISSSPIKLEHSFDCEPSDLFRSFTAPEMIRVYGGSDSVVQDKKLTLFSGNVYCEIEDQTPAEKLVMKWRFSSWPKEHFSKVVMTFEKKKNKTLWVMTQTNVPSDDVSRVESGWRQNYVSRISGAFGWGAPMF